jgi:hypothetical protein
VPVDWSFRLVIGCHKSPMRWLDILLSVIIKINLTKLTLTKPNLVLPSLDKPNFSSFILS